MRPNDNCPIDAMRRRLLTGAGAALSLGEPVSYTHLTLPTKA